MKEAIHNNETCVFDPVKHTYILSDGVSLPSATTYAKKFFKEFDSLKISEAYARKNNLNQQDVLDMWEAKRNKSAEFGTKCHKYAEDCIDLYKIHKAENCFLEPSNNHEIGIRDKLSEIVNNYDIVGQELILFSREMHLAGTADLLLSDKDTLYICDWKTNEEIKTSNKYQKALDCLYTYDDCEYTKYMLQLNLYLKMIQTEKYFENFNKYKLVLFHVQDKVVKEIPLNIFPKYIMSRI
jgi:ATP-dependent exoDNAse (exonuclease V) beta subunit